MKKQSAKKQQLKNGIVIRVTRSGLFYASYFDSENDFNSLKESLLAILKNKDDCWYEFNVDENLNDHDLFSAMQKIVNESDFGQIKIVENLQS